MTPEDRKLLQDTHDAVIDMTRMCHGHEKTLYGNGQPGLVQQHQILSTKQEECPARNSSKQGGRVFNLGVIMCLLSAVHLVWMIIEGK